MHGPMTRCPKGTGRPRTMGPGGQLVLRFWVRGLSNFLILAHWRMSLGREVLEYES